MRRCLLTLVLLSFCTCTALRAQCGIWPSVYLNPTCDPEISVSGYAFGGTPPYTFTIEVNRGGWQLVHQESGNTSGYTQAYYPVDWFTWMTESRLTVTDATGCSEVDTQSYPETFVGVAAWNWNGTPVCSPAGVAVDLYMPTLPTPPTYRIDNGPELSWASGWTQTGSSNYRLNAPWPTGSHTLSFPEHTTGGFRICAQSTVISGNPPSCVGLRVRGALDGALTSGTLMSDSLRALGLIPVATTQGIIANGVLSVTGNDAIVDRVTVELRSTSSPWQVISSGFGLLQRDGDVVELNGSPGIRMPAAAGSYYVALRHRNHLGVMTAAPVNITQFPAATLVDFKLGSTATWGTNARVLKGTEWCLWGGDASPNGVLKYTGSFNDRDPILSAVGGNTPNTVLQNVYDNRDVNMDGRVKYTGANNDRDPILVNIGGSVPTNTRTQQLP